MYKPGYRYLGAWVMALALVGNLPAFISAQSGQPQESEKKEKKEKKGMSGLNPFSKDKKKEETKEASTAEQEKPSKQEREYQKIKQYSDKLYNEDPAFREEVEDAYRQKKREHSDYAFFINTRDAEDQQVMRTGDKLKVEDTLYDNPLVQDYVNRVGQSVVPKDSSKLFAFKVTLNPVPEARSLSTGTVYVSSGLLSLIDNEAQLAYVLGHEIAHVEKDHWHQDVLVERGIQRYNEKQQQKRALIGGLTSIGLGAIAGGFTGSFSKAGLAALYAQLALPTLLKLAVPDVVISWDKAQEDEADQFGLKYMLDRNYDPREVPKFYAALQRASQRDQRAGLGFLGDATRIVERTQQVSNLIGGFGNLNTTGLYVGAITLRMQQETQAAMASAQQFGSQSKEADKGKAITPERDAAGRAAAAEKAIGGVAAAELKAKLDAGVIIGSSAEFEAVMAELKRDNGVRAYYYDMFQMARDNLEESLQIRSNDPFAHFYYGKVLKLTARTAPEKQRAMVEFVKAIELDKRRVLAEPHLYQALAMIDSKNPALTAEIVASLKEYVTVYQRANSGKLPDNMDVIYDYLQEVGETARAARPAINVSTKGIDPIEATQPFRLSTPAADTGANSTRTVTAPNSAPKPHRP